MAERLKQEMELDFLVGTESSFICGQEDVSMVVEGEEPAGPRSGETLCLCWTRTG